MELKYQITYLNQRTGMRETYLNGTAFDTEEEAYDEIRRLIRDRQPRRFGPTERINYKVKPVKIKLHGTKV